MDNMSDMQRAAIALCDASDALRNATAFTAVVLSKGLETAFVATVKGKAFPFVLSDYAHKPMTAKGKVDTALRNAQFSAIMEQGFGEETAPDAVKTGFNKAFPAALYMAAHGGASFDEGEGFVFNSEGEFENVPLDMAFACYNGEGELTETGKALAERVTAMYSPEKGPEMSQAEALADMATRTTVANGKLNRRYGLNSLSVTKVLEVMGKRAEAEGLKWSSTGSRVARNTSAKPSEAIAAFEAFIADITGKDGEAKIALNPEGVAALKKLQGNLAAAIKAIA